MVSRKTRAFAMGLPSFTSKPRPSTVMHVIEAIKKEKIYKNTFMGYFWCRTIQIVVR